MNPILEQFLVEARENLLFLDKNLESLRDGDKEIVNALFRSAHTLKGSSGLAGLDGVKEVTHIAEDLLDAYRNNKITFSEHLLEVLYDMFDEVTEIIDATEECGDIIEVDLSKVEEFENLRAKLLDEKEEVQEGLDTELILVDDEIPVLAEMIPNEFDSIDLSNIPLDPQKVTNNSLEEDNYYIIDIDLNVDSIELGNDPVYSLYQLENDNIITITTALGSSCEDIKSDPNSWATRFIVLAKSNKDFLEDSFFNFIDEVTIYPLSIKALLNSNLQAQSNDVIEEFISDLKTIISSNDLSSLSSKLDAVLDILNPESLQGFLFKRLQYIFDNSMIDTKKSIEILKYTLNLIGEEEKESSIKEENKIENSSGLNIDEDEAIILVDILSQQKTVLRVSENDNVTIQVKAVLKNISVNTQYDLDIDQLNSNEQLFTTIDNLLNELSDKYGIKIPEDKIQEIIPTPKASPKEPIKETKQTKPTDNKSKTIKTVDEKPSKQLAKTVKIDLQDIDSMMDIVGEMLVIKNALPYISEALNIENVEVSKRDLMARYDEINRVTTQLQEKVMQMRLLSLSFIFDRYPKLIRDISKSLSKKIKYTEMGGDTKLDKTVIEKLADPLIHIIRNSLDHGIEEPDVRTSKGKNPEGNIVIKAQSIGDKVYVTIEDDGKGIDVQTVVRKALEKKTVDPDKLDEMSEQEKLLLVFEPGVSTMDQISELSGRGVGMDVVRKTIDDVAGKISIESEIDVGTKITLELPMSVALTSVFHVKLGTVNYALSMDSINETVRVARDDVEYINEKPMLKLRGNLIPLIFYENLLSNDVHTRDYYSLVLVESQGVKFGFIVDEFVNQLDIVQKPLSSNFKNHPFISGTSLLGNGEVLFVLNPSKLTNLKEKK